MTRGIGGRQVISAAHAAKDTSSIIHAMEPIQAIRRAKVEKARVKRVAVHEKQFADADHAANDRRLPAADAVAEKNNRRLYKEVQDRALRHEKTIVHRMHLDGSKPQGDNGAQGIPHLKNGDLLESDPIAN